MASNFASSHAMKATLATTEIDDRISAAEARQKLGLSRTSFDRLAASGVLGHSITYSDARNAMRFFKRAVIADYLAALDRKSTYGQYEIKAKAARLLRG